MKDLTEKLEALGFTFPQGEFCTKGKMTVILGCFPYIFETGENESFLFETYEEFHTHYTERMRLNAPKNKKAFLGLIIGITALALSFIWFGWKLPFVLILALWGNNLERSSQKLR
jgi:hypothetical protein